MGDPFLLDKDKPYLFLDNLLLLSYVLTLALSPSLVKYPKPIGVSRLSCFTYLQEEHYTTRLALSSPNHVTCVTHGQVGHIGQLGQFGHSPILAYYSPVT